MVDMTAFFFIEKESNSEKMFYLQQLFLNLLKKMIENRSEYSFSGVIE